MNRRTFGVAVPLAAALMGCSALTPAQSATLRDIITRTSEAIQFVGPIIPVIALFVPAAAPFVGPINAGLALAYSTLGTVTADMATATAKPIVRQVATALGDALNTADQAALLIPDAKKRAAIQATLGEARAVLPLLTAFATGMAAVVAPRASLVGPVAVMFRR